MQVISIIFAEEWVGVHEPDIFSSLIRFIRVGKITYISTYSYLVHYIYRQPFYLSDIYLL